jgi:vancomycin resistance protein VanJ
VSSEKAGAPRPGRKPTLFGRLVTLLVVGYLAGVVVVALTMVFAVDRHWAATLLGFGPRWVFALPLPVVALAALASFRWKLLIPVAVSALLVVFAILDGSIGIGGGGDGQPVRVITQNLGAAVKLDDPRFVAYLKETRPDVMVIQECWRDDQPTGSPDPDYHFAMDYTMCVLSKFPVTKVTGRPRTDVWDRGGSGEIGVFEIQGPKGPFYILSVQLETAREGFEAFLSDKLGGVPKMEQNRELRRWESQLASEWAAQHAKSPLLVVGDFNMPVESAIYKQYWGHLSNAWGRCGTGFGYTKRTRKIGARIDHVLFDQGWQCADATIAPDLGSDHRGLIVDLRLP